MLPRLIRLRDAPSYIGMDKARFNSDVRPQLVEIPIGIQGLAFDRLDLDAWVDQYKQCNGRPGAKRRHLWVKNTSQVLKKSATSGTLTRESTVVEFAKVLEQVTSKKQKDS